MRNTVAVLLLLQLITGTVLSAQTRERSTDSSSHGSKHQYKGFGDDNIGARCNNQPLWPGNCRGSLPSESKRSPVELAKWIHGVRWQKDSSRRQRERAGPGISDPYLTVWGITNAHDISLKKLGKDTLLVAKISTESEVKDKFYEIHKGKNATGTATYTGEFFIFTESFDTLENAPKPPPASRKISRWFVMGLAINGADGREVLIPTGRRGNLRWCADTHPHDVSSGFLGCDAKKTLDSLEKELRKNKRLSDGLGSQSLLKFVQTNLPVQRPGGPGAPGPFELFGTMQSNAVVAFIRASGIRLDPYRDAAWMICGVGCCTADESQY